MWGLQQQVLELRMALAEIKLIAEGGAGPEDDGPALALIVEIAGKVLAKT